MLGCDELESKSRSLAIITILLSLGCCLGAAELALRFLPVYSGLRIENTTKESPVFRAAPNREYSYSSGCCFALANKGRVNNEGFVNDQDYIKEGIRPLVAVVGDSYIESLMVPFEDTLHARLAKHLEDSGRVYSFAFSGAPLSQYLVWADYARNTFKPDAFIFNVVGNDFDESLYKYKNAEGFHYFRESGTGLTLELVEFRVSWLGRAVRSSALLQYLVNNLNAHVTISAVVGKVLGAVGAAEANATRDSAEFVGNTRAFANNERVTDSLEALDTFLAALPQVTGVASEKVLFVVDGVRQRIYGKISREQAERSYFGIMRKALIERAKNKGYSVLDLETVFEQEYDKEKKKFEFENDFHWSGYGHEVVSEAILKSDWLRKL